MTDKRYGYVDDREAYGLADMVFGHRFWDSQTATEYLLEFLCVLSGFQYDLGRYADPTAPEDERENQVKYPRLKRIGLRRFVFYAGERKSTDNLDTEALRRLEERLRQKVTSEPDNRDALGPLRAFLRSFSAVERSRSWYAKSLFPAHERLLFWEGLRKNAGKGSVPEEVLKEMKHSALDQGFSVGERNFFARGGEMVYLMLGAGTKDDPKTRKHIEDKLKTLLTEDTRLGQLAELVDASWQELLDEADGPRLAHVAELSGGYDSAENHGYLGWLPDDDLRAYRIFAEDVAALLNCNLDHVELFHLLVHLVGFHVVRYLYERAYHICGDKGPDGVVRPSVLIDAVDTGEDRAIRYASALLFKRNQELLIKAAQSYVERLAHSAADSADPLTRVLESFGGMKAGKKLGAKLTEQAALVVKAKESGDHAALLECVTTAVMAIYDDQFSKRFLPVHRRLAKEIGLVAPKTGTSERYVMGDALLKALVLANVTHDQEFHMFVKLLFERYGLVIGPEQLKNAAWSRAYDINTQYYQANMDAFRRKLKNCGLLTEYSDATALVQNRSFLKKGEVEDNDA